MRNPGPPEHPLRDRVHLGSFLCNLALIISVVAVLTIFQGSGILSVSSDRLALNTVELIAMIFLLTVLATFFLFEFFLIGIPQFVL